MALTTTDLGFSNTPQGLAAVRTNLDLLLQEGKGAFNFAFKDHVWAGICHLDFGNRAGKTQLRSPLLGWGSG